MRLFLLFRLGERQFGLDTAEVQEVSAAPPLHFIPRGPRNFLGAVSLHGQIVPVVDLAGLCDCSDPTRDGRLIVLKSARGLLALAVPLVQRTAFLDGDGIQPPPDREEGIDALVGGVYADEERTVYLLDPAKLYTHLEKL